MGGGGMHEEDVNAPERGSDISVELEISLEDAAKGASRTIRYNRLVECPDCKGTGSKSAESRNWQKKHALADESRKLCKILRGEVWNDARQKRCRRA